MPTKKGGQPPYGFKWHQGELVHEHEEAKIYALIFELFLVHQRKQTIAKQLNERGLRTRTGGEFKYSIIKNLLTKEVAIGIHRSSIVETNEDGEKVNTVIDAHIEPIVSKKVWQHTQAIIEEQAGVQPRSPSQDIFIGKVVCDCGGVMELPSKSKEYKCPGCKQTISIEDVWLVTEHVFSELSLPSKAELEKISRTALFGLQNDTTALFKQVNKEIDKLFDLHKKETISDEVFSARYEPLEERKKQLESQNQDEKIEPSSASFLEQWQVLSSDMKRIVVENLIDSIRITPQKATISLYPLFNFAQQVTTSRP